MLNYMKYINFVFVAIAILFGYLYFSAKSNASKQEMITKQNELALGDSLKILHKNNDEMYQQYAEVTKTNQYLTDLLKSRNDNIQTLIKEVVRLQTIISSG